MKILSNDELEKIYENYGKQTSGESVGVRKAICELIDSHNEIKYALDSLCLNENQLKILKTVSKSHRVNMDLEEKTYKTPLKKFYADCLKENINIQPLIRCLSTVYAHNQVVKGLSAMIRGKIWLEHKEYKQIMDQIEDLSIEINLETWNMESMLGYTLDWLTERETK